MESQLRIVICGLSITSSWGNGHATTYRGLVRGLTERGHDVLFLERDVPWYAQHRDLPDPPYGRTCLYGSLTEFKDRFAREIRDADLVIVGSYVPDGVPLGEWVMSTANGIVAFYDIDTPVTLAKLARGDKEYLSRALVMRYDLYLSFTGGPTLRTLETKYYSPHARVLYCSVDPDAYYPENARFRWDLGYLGTYSNDRQPVLNNLMLDAARSMPEARFVVAGPLYPAGIEWPPNVERIDHLPPGEHRNFYNSQRFTLNVTRAEMVRAGWSPSVRLFEAAACGTPIVSDYWRGLEDVFEIDTEVLVSHSAEETRTILKTLSEDERLAIGERLRNRVLREHTFRHRASQLEGYARDLMESARVPARNVAGRR